MEILYHLIDTAGIRRKHAEHEVVDKFAAIRTQRAIERADICFLMLDAQQGITARRKKNRQHDRRGRKRMYLAVQQMGPCQRVPHGALLAGR